MTPFELPARTVEDVARLLRALGSHRYVASRLHLVHAFVFEAVEAAGSVVDPLAEGVRWARSLRGTGDLDVGSRDERLFRASSEEEVALALETFWRPGAAADRAHEHLMDRLRAIDVDVPTHEPFDERFEDETHPVLVDAGWELLRMSALDPERHRGARQAFGEPIDFESARFEEQSLLEAPTYVQELSQLGPAELLRGVDAGGSLAAPLVLWTEGPLPYHDYVVRGVLRAARLAGD